MSFRLVINWYPLKDCGSVFFSITPQKKGKKLAPNKRDFEVNLIIIVPDEASVIFIAVQVNLMSGQDLKTLG
jgi:hypothetical protein